MEFKKWKNKYIELVSSKPGLLLPCIEERLSEQEREILLAKIARSKEVYFDLGSGSGGHALELARRSANGLIVGVELRYKRAYRTTEKAEKHALENVLVVRGDARMAVAAIQDGCVDGFFINFPDPWDKRRWHKNRLFNHAFISELLAKLKRGGFISHKSDHPEYFQFNLELLQSFAELQIEKISYDWHKECPPELEILSEFEKLFRSQRQPINYLLARKVFERS